MSIDPAITIGRKMRKAWAHGKLTIDSDDCVDVGDFVWQKKKKFHTLRVVARLSPGQSSGDETLQGEESLMERRKTVDTI